ncbi:AraC family transcriptional regulator [Halioglobus japonicus]|uniref:AraC family transcriptional regulator n=1 Tax=Halioglobus japonicus TaxID=930805 RepID=A0AAP8ME94_9GAMM|nr:AraC family transcriptional regulator [Halioglobus japonicus]AQA17963.1 AraC family transcriptional regulator [Halioglobus japonicus]PLW85927.1 AraC family transcriptional regulator [Halioglobus japonicus]GHD18228.1 ornithine utilization regulator [Halioglobus japonicus]
MPKHTTPAQYALILIDMVEDSTGERQRLLHGTSMAEGDFASIGARVEDRDFITLANNALALTGDPALGLRLGMSLNLGAHAILGQAFMTCRDLGEAVNLFLKYHHLLSSNLSLAYSVNEGWCSLVSVDRPQDLPEQFSYEMLFAAMLNTLRGLINDPQMQAEVDFPYPEPAHAEHYYRVFGDGVRFNCAQPALRFRTQLLNRPLPASNPALRNLYEQECARLLADLEGEESIEEQTLRLLRKLEGQYPQMPQVAHMLNLSPRTYRRRLQQEQQSYQTLLDQVRAEHATHYLRNSRLPMSTIAYMVGFNDSSNFRRAYAKWTGRAPGEVRRGE